MKKIKVLIYLVALMILATGCVQNGGDFGSVEDNNTTPDINGSATTDSEDLPDTQEDESLIHEWAIVPDEAAMDTEPMDPESLLFFDPESLYLGKALNEVNEIHPDLEFVGNLAGGSIFYCADKDIYLIFSAYAMEYPDKSAIDAIIERAEAKAEDIFPNMTDKITKETIEESGGTGWNIGENGKDSELAPAKAYVASFKYAGYEFRYFTDDSTGAILPEQGIDVKMPIKFVMLEE